MTVPMKLPNSIESAIPDWAARPVEQLLKEGDQVLWVASENKFSISRLLYFCSLYFPLIPHGTIAGAFLTFVPLMILFGLLARMGLQIGESVIPYTIFGIGWLAYTIVFLYRAVPAAIVTHLTIITSSRVIKLDSLSGKMVVERATISSLYPSVSDRNPMLTIKSSAPTRISDLQLRFASVDELREATELLLPSSKPKEDDC